MPPAPRPPARPSQRGEESVDTFTSISWLGVPQAPGASQVFPLPQTLSPNKPSLP